MDTPEETGFVYILTNEQSFKSGEWVKIGRTDKTVEERIRGLATGAPFPFRKFASLHTMKSEEIEKTIHDLIGIISPSSRLSIEREFFELSPIRAAMLVQRVASILGEQNQVKYFDEEGEGRVIYRCNLSGADAFGFDNGDKFTVLKGSLIGDEVSSLKSYRQAVSALRNDLVKNKVIRNCIFMTDYIFESPAVAATAIMGRPNGSSSDWTSLIGEPHQ